MYDRGAVISTLRTMPPGARFFLGYGFALLTILGLTLPRIISLAVEMPVSGVGIVWMLLLAYTVFTLTLVLQRKQAAYPLALGLASLTIPLVPLLGLLAGLPGAAVALALAVVLFVALRRPATRAWFVEP